MMKDQLGSGWLEFRECIMRRRSKWFSTAEPSGCQERPDAHAPLAATDRPKPSDGYNDLAGARAGHSPATAPTHYDNCYVERMVPARGWRIFAESGDEKRMKRGRWRCIWFMSETEARERKVYSSSSAGYISCY